MWFVLFHSTGFRKPCVSRRRSNGEVRSRAHPLAWSGRGKGRRARCDHNHRPWKQANWRGAPGDQVPSGLCSGAERAGFRFLQHSSEFAWFSHAWGLFISHFYHKILQTWSLSWDCSRWPVYSGTLLLWVRGAWTVPRLNDGDGIERLCWNSIIPPQNNMELGTGVQALHLTL